MISIKIDRNFVDQDGTRWIIDYKTSRHEEEDLEAALEQFREIASDLGEEEKEAI